MGCADIAITTDGDAAPVTPRPTKAPTKAAPVTPKPTPRPTTKDEFEWDCSEYSESCHRIDHNNGDAFKALGNPCANVGLDTNFTVTCAGASGTCVRLLVGMGNYSACAQLTERWPRGPAAAGRGGGLLGARRW